MTCDIDQQFDTFNAKGTSPFDTFVHLKEALGVGETMRGS
jgi:hypothetical protein